jgi:hypothetical protein
MYTTVKEEGNVLLYASLKRMLLSEPDAPSPGTDEDDTPGTKVWSFSEDGNIDYKVTLSKLSLEHFKLDVSLRWIAVKWLASLNAASSSNGQPGASLMAYLTKIYPASHGFHISTETNADFHLRVSFDSQARSDPITNEETIRHVSLLKWHILAFPLREAFDFVLACQSDASTLSGRLPSPSGKIFSGGADILTMNPSEHKDMSLLKRLDLLYIPLKDAGEEAMILQAMEDRLVVHWRIAFQMSNVDKVFSKLFIQVI